jgi:hypothetical protein
MKIVFVIILAIATVAITAVVAINLDKNKRTKTTTDRNTLAKHGGIGQVRYLKWYRKFDNFFLTHGGFNKIVQRISEMSILSAQDVRITAVRVYAVSLGISVAVVILSIFMFQDVFTTLLVILYAIIMKTTIIDKQIDNVHFNILKQLSMALSSVRQEYMMSESIADSVAGAEVGKLLARSFENIYIMLTSSDSEQRLDEFYAATPFKQLRTFAGVCYKLNDEGDVKLKDGTMNFINTIEMLTDEVNLEIRKVTSQKSRFGMLEFLPIFPLLFVSLIGSFFGSRIPGTQVIYQGPIGYISRTIILISSIVGYVAISRVNSVVSVRMDDRSDIIMKLLAIPQIKAIVKNLVPKNTDKLRDKSGNLKIALSKMDINQFYALKLFVFCAVLIGSITCSVLVVNLGKQFIYNSVEPMLQMTGPVTSKADIAAMHKLDDAYLKIQPMPTDKQTSMMVKEYVPNLSEYDLESQVSRVEQKYKMYYSTYYQWWILVICFVISIISWFIPDLMLFLRALLLKTESEEDVLQLQTIIAILMNTSIDTMDTLYWMSKQSRILKDVLMQAYYDYPSDPDRALSRLITDASMPEFKKIVDKLKLTIHQIRLSEAFSDLSGERDHALRIREMAQTTAINNKRILMSPFALAPIFLTIFLYFLLPIGILGFQYLLGTMGGSGPKI